MSFSRDITISPPNTLDEVTDTPLKLLGREFTNEKSTSALEFFLLGAKVQEWNNLVRAQQWRIKLFDDGAWIHSLRIPETSTVETALLVAIGRAFLDKDDSIHTIFENCPVTMTIGKFANLTHVPLHMVGLEWQLYAILPDGETRHVFAHDEPLCSNFSWNQLKQMEFRVTPLTSRNAPVVEEPHHEPMQLEDSSDEESDPHEASPLHDETDFFHPYSMDASQFETKWPRDTLRIFDKTVFMQITNCAETFDLPGCATLTHGENQIVRFACSNDAMALNRGLILWAAQHHQRGPPSARRADEIRNVLMFILDMPHFNVDLINECISYVNEKLKLEDTQLRAPHVKAYLQQLSKFSRIIPTIANKRQRVE